MGKALDRLIDLLDLEQIEVNIFRGRSPEERVQRVFGGQVAGQALVAAGRTVPPDRPVHSLPAYFIPPGVGGAARRDHLHPVRVLPPSRTGSRARRPDAGRPAARGGGAELGPAGPGAGTGSSPGSRESGRPAVDRADVGRGGP